MTGPGVELEWIISDDDADWTRRETRPPPPPHKRRRILLIAALASLALAITATLTLQRRIVENQRQIKTDLQALVDLEARAIANGDRELFLSLKSKDNVTWLEEQERVFDYCTANAGQWPRLRVTGVELVDDYAWVHVTGTSAETSQRFQWVRFYRWLGDGWRQAAPDPRYWGSEQERVVGSLHLVYHERDEPYVEPLAADLTGQLSSLCNDLGCSASLSLTVQLTPPHLYSRLFPTTSAMMALPSPVTQPRPADAPPQITILDSQQSALAHYVAFEAAGGDKRWENDQNGAWLVHAIANWAQERLERKMDRPSWHFYTGQGQEALRMAARTGRVLSLSSLWRSPYFDGDAYLDMVARTLPFIYFEDALARAVVDHTVETYGQATIPKLLRAMARHDTLEATLWETLGVGLDEFEPLWLTWLETHYGLGKGWRLAEAIVYWKQAQDNLLAFIFQSSTFFRQCHELMRVAVRENRVLPLEVLWRGTNLGITATPETISYSLVKTELAVTPLYPSTEVFAKSTDSPTSSVLALIRYPVTWRSAHALSVIEFVAHVYGKPAVDDLLPAIVRNDSLDGALRDALGVGLDEFEHGWQIWLKARFERDTD
jgi:hypothetical protein